MTRQKTKRKPEEMTKREKKKTMKKRTQKKKEDKGNKERKYNTKQFFPRIKSKLIQKLNQSCRRNALKLYLKQT